MTIYEKAIAKWGVERQKMKVIEELSELIRAISRDDRENVLEEILDVYAMLRQLILIYELEDAEMENMECVKSAQLQKALEE